LELSVDLFPNLIERIFNQNFAISKDVDKSVGPPDFHLLAPSSFKLVSHFNVMVDPSEEGQISGF
jgi:hypothetical protein